MAKQKTQYVCQSCGYDTPRWEGKCPSCDSWNTLVEEKIVTAPKTASKNRGWALGEDAGQKLKTTKFSEFVAKNSLKTEASKKSGDKSADNGRISTGISEFDRVLGGGLVGGSYILLGGDPGIGKSTILLQMVGNLAEGKTCFSKGKNPRKVLYVSGEESVDQTFLRAQRVGLKSDYLEVASESKIENIIELANSNEPDVIVVDSIQTVYSQELSSAPGTVAQVRESASHLMSLAKSKGIIVFIIGHVTKEGNIAGPKVLEHMVDTVLSFEGDSNHQFRLLRALKNRFGATNELGVFEMHSTGLVEVTNPSEIFIQERGEDLIGSVIFSAMEGSRPLLCEVQALTSTSPTAFPRRTSLGFDGNRVHLLVAILAKHLDMDLNKDDVFINVVGGLKLTEPSADLAVASALISSYFQSEAHPRTCFAGELGLTGEVRGVSFVEDRVREAQKLGFEHFVLPFANRKHLKKFSAKDINLIFVKNVNGLQNAIRNSAPSKRRSPEPTNELDAHL